MIAHIDDAPTTRTFGLASPAVGGIGDVQGVVCVDDEGDADLVGELKETRVDRVESPLQGHHDFDPGTIAQRSKLSGFREAGREGLLLQDVDMMFSRRRNDRLPGVVGDSDDDEIEVLRRQHRLDTRVAGNVEPLALFPDHGG